MAPLLNLNMNKNVSLRHLFAKKRISLCRILRLRNFAGYHVSGEWYIKIPQKMSGFGIHRVSYVPIF